jgi:hypothetical protein
MTYILFVVGTEFKCGLKSIIANTFNSANQLNNNEAMSYMGMPYGPDCYFPRKDVVERILKDVNDVPKEILQRMVMTHEFRYMHSYWKPPTLALRGK